MLFILAALDGYSLCRTHHYPTAHIMTNHHPDADPEPESQPCPSHLLASRGPSWMLVVMIAQRRTFLNVDRSQPTSRRSLVKTLFALVQQKRNFGAYIFSVLLTIVLGGQISNFRLQCSNNRGSKDRLLQFIQKQLIWSMVAFGRKKNLSEIVKYKQVDPSQVSLKMMEIQHNGTRIVQLSQGQTSS